MAPLRSLVNPVSKFDDFYGETGFEVKNRLYVDDVFSTYLYEGTGTAQTITNGIDLSGEGGMVWTKCRSLEEAHMVFDTERGVWNRVFTNSTTAESTSSNTLTAFNSDGFTIGDNNIFNTNGSSNCSWTFRKAPGFFDVVTYTGQSNNGVNDTWITIPHSLGTTPGCIIIKSTSNAESWVVWHRSESSKTTFLNTTGAANSSNYTTIFGHANGAADANNIYVRAGQFLAGYQGYSYVAYVFAHDDQRFGENGNEAIIHCGTFNGGGVLNTTTIEVNTGFEAQFVLIKRTDGTSTSDWYIFDAMRGMDNDGNNDKALFPNTTDDEGAPFRLWPYQNGFAFDEDLGGSSADWIYIAIRRPHKPITDPTKLFAVGSNTKSEPEYISDFVVDMALHRNVGSNLTDDTAIFSRLTGSKALRTNSTAAETEPNSIDQFDFMNGWGDNQANDNNYKSWMFRRAPGFMDVVSYTGNNTPRTINHNLGAVPELMIVKDRSRLEEWMVYSATTGANKWLRLHTDDSEINDSQGDMWGGTTPTSSVFSLGNSSNTNHDGSEIIAHLFSTLPGISKVGSYSGTGNNVDVDCGFTAGARFVLIKRTDYPSTGDWYVWDYVRGISSGNDPYILLNSDAAEITNTDYIDPLNSGFTVTSSAPADLNDSSGTYLFLAIA